MKNNNRFRDLGLRQALKHRNEESERLTLSEDFTDRLMRRIEQKQKTPHRTVWLYPAIGAIAASLLLLMTLQHNADKAQEQPRVIQYVQKQQGNPCEKVQLEPTIAVAVSENKTEQHVGYNEKYKPKVQQPKVAIQRPEVKVDAQGASTDPNIHQASYTQTEDTVPQQSPVRMDEFIAKIAAYNCVEENVLDCTSGQPDTAVVSKTYLFEDTEELNLFNRLLQAACWYDSKTPGYLLNYSHQQFFFCLKDLQQGLKYLWIAERLQGKILLYCTHSPIGVEVSSACYQEYHEQITHTGIKPKTSDI